MPTSATNRLAGGAVQRGFRGVPPRAGYSVRRPSSRRAKARTPGRFLARFRTPGERVIRPLDEAISGLDPGELASDRRPAFEDAGERLLGTFGRRVSAKIGERVFGRGEEMREAGTLVADAGKRYLDAVVARIIARQDLAPLLGLPLSATLKEVEDACSTQLAAANARESKVLDRAKSLPGDWSLEKAFRALSPEDRNRVLQRMPELVQLIPKALRIARGLAEGHGLELD